MDERVKDWREQAADFRKIADGTSDDRTRQSLLKLVGEYLELAKRGEEPCSNA